MRNSGPYSLFQHIELTCCLVFSTVSHTVFFGHLGEIIADQTRTHVGSHDDYRVLEIDTASFIVGKMTVVEHLKKNIEDVGMSLLDLIEEHY